MLVPVILAGGGGTRLAPLSTPDCPKPFIPIHGEGNLLEATLRRTLHLPNLSHVILITATPYEAMAQDACAATLAEYPQIIPHILLEEHPRNTALAFAHAAAYAQKFLPEATLLYLPADHWVEPESAWVDAMLAGYKKAQSGLLTCFGIAPDTPSTEYGYMELGAGDRVQRFVEKPDVLTAQSYVKSGQYLWNSGMLCGQVSTLLAALKDHSEMSYYAAMATQYAPTEYAHSWRLHGNMHPHVPARSFDYEVLEKLPQLLVQPCSDFTWKDLGTLEAFCAQFNVPTPALAA